MPALYLVILLAFQTASDTQALICRHSPTAVRLTGADAVTSAMIPKGWCYQETSDGVSAQPNDVRGVVVNLDWYHPYRDAAYADFRARIREEVRSIRETKTSVHTRNFIQAGLPAVEVRARERGGRRLVYTYIGFQPPGETGSLFVVILSEPATASHLDTYRAIVRSIRIKPEDR
jgi:hypothetical protein